MNIDNLVTMANQIGTFFASYPDREEGRIEFANHLPRMRRRLFSHIDEAHGEGLNPIVVEALLEHRRQHMSLPPPGGDAG